MTDLVLYRGLWPKTVSKTAKYAVRNKDGEWEVTVFIDLGNQEKALAVEGAHQNIIDKVNEIKFKLNFKEGGPFYINEYQQLLVPVKEQDTSYYYYGGKVDVDFKFHFEGNVYTSKPVDLDGVELKPGDEWPGPRPGIPYFLASGGSDIKYKTHSFTDDDPPRIRENVERKVSLLKECKDRDLALENIKMVREIKSHNGGRFYVNESLAVFAPLKDKDEDNWEYVYCGNLNLDGWFPEPHQ